MASELGIDAVTALSLDLARALVAYSSDGLVIVDADGTLRFASPWAERMLGYEPGRDAWAGTCSSWCTPTTRSARSKASTPR